MRRVILALFAAALGFIGLAQIAPQPTNPPDFGTTDSGSIEGAVASPSVWYCPWVEAGAVLDTDIVVVSEPDVDVAVTLLDPLANMAPTIATESIVGPGAAGIASGDILRVGESPAIVEISNGPAAAASLQYADALIAGDQCVSSVPKIWYLTGGSTKPGTFTELRLFNPFADNAEVVVTAYSEFDLDLVAELDGIDVPGRAWTTIDLEPYLPLRDELAFTISTTQGLVIPAIIRSDESGEAMWPGSAPAETWEFPIVTPGDLEPFIAVMSAGDDDITVTIDIVTEEGTLRDAREISVDSSAPALIALSDLAAAPFGVRVRASAPIAASVIAVVPGESVDGGEGGDDESTTTSLADDDQSEEPTEDEFIHGLAGTIGSPRSALEWFVPVDTLPGSETTMWIMNAGSEVAGVQVGPLGEVEYAVFDFVEVPAESILGIPVDVGIGIFGVVVRSDALVSVSWEITGDRGSALVAGIPKQ